MYHILNVSIDRVLYVTPNIFLRCIKVQLHQEEANIFFDVCRLCFDLFRFLSNVRLLWIGP